MRMVGGTGIIGQDMVCGFGKGNLFKDNLLHQGGLNSSEVYNYIRVNSDIFHLPIGKYKIDITDKKLEMVIYPDLSTSSNIIGWASSITWINDSKINSIKIIVRKKDNSGISVDEVKGKIILKKI